MSGERTPGEVEACAGEKGTTIKRPTDPPATVPKLHALPDTRPPEEQAFDACIRAARRGAPKDLTSIFLGWLVARDKDPASEQMASGTIRMHAEAPRIRLVYSRD